MFYIDKSIWIFISIGVLFQVSDLTYIGKYEKPFHSILQALQCYILDSKSILCKFWKVLMVGFMQKNTACKASKQHPISFELLSILKQMLTRISIGTILKLGLHFFLIFWTNLCSEFVLLQHKKNIIAQNKWFSNKTNFHNWFSFFNMF